MSNLTSQNNTVLEMVGEKKPFHIYTTPFRVQLQQRFNNKMFYPSEYQIKIIWQL